MVTVEAGLDRLNLGSPLYVEREAEESTPVALRVPVCTRTAHVDWTPANNPLWYVTPRLLHDTHIWHIR